MDYRPLIQFNFESLMNKYKVKKDRFKVNAYKKALDNLPNNVYSLDDIKDGTGKKTYEKMRFMIENNKNLEEVEEYINDDSCRIIETLQTVHGIGPTKATELYHEHGVRTMDDLRSRAAQLLNDKQQIGLLYYDDILKRIPYTEMSKHDEFVGRIVDTLRKERQLEDADIRYVVVGSYRRKLKDSGDIDVLITGKKNFLDLLIERLIQQKYLVDTAVLAKGTVKFMGLCKLPRHKNYRRIDILYTPPEEYPFAELYFTGSYRFNIRMRSHAAKLGYTLNEQALTRTDTKSIVSKEFRTEKDIFSFLEFEYLEPENRVD